MGFDLSETQLMFGFLWISGLFTFLAMVILGYLNAANIKLK